MKNFKMMCASLMLAAGVAGSASGAIQYFNLSPGVTVNFTVYKYDPTAGTGVLIGDPNFSSTPTLVGLNTADGGLETANGWEMLTSGGAVVLLSSGSSIDVNSGTWSSGYAFIGDETVGDTVYYGISDGTNAGWLQVRRDGDSNYTLLASGLSDSSTILAGEGQLGGGSSAVPEPGTAAMLGIGVVMLSAARRRFRHDA
jgi:hypothetical protein